MDEEEFQVPPTSIEIGTLPFAANTGPAQVEKEIGSDPAPESETNATPAPSEPDNGAVKMQPLSEEVNDAYMRYIRVKEAKPSDGASYVGIAVMIAGFFLGFMAFGDDFGLALTICFGGCLIGVILIFLSLVAEETWKKDKNLKLEETLAKAGIPDVYRKNEKPLGAALLMVGFFAMFFISNFFYNLSAMVFIFGLGSTIAGAIILLRVASQDKKAMQIRMAVLEDRLKGK